MAGSFCLGMVGDCRRAGWGIGAGDLLPLRMEVQTTIRHGRRRAREIPQRWDERLSCQSASKIDPQSACNIDPLSGTAEVVPVVNRGDPSGFV